MHIARNNKNKQAAEVRKRLKRNLQVCIVALYIDTAVQLNLYTSYTAYYLPLWLHRMAYRPLLALSLSCYQRIMLEKLELKCSLMSHLCI